MKNFAGLFVLIAVVAGCSSFSGSKETANNTAPQAPTTAPVKNDQQPVDPAGLTLEKYDQLQVGTKYDEVVKILGSEGVETSSSSSAGNKYATYKWEGSTNARITATFKNGDLQSKNQSNLRSTTGTPASVPISMAKYDQISTGMSYPDVVKVVGGEGIQTSSSTSGSYKNTTYRWEGEKNARIYVIFKDGKVASKSQSNLK